MIRDNSFRFPRPQLFIEIEASYTSVQDVEFCHSDVLEGGGI